MTTLDFSTATWVNQTPKEVFDAINHISGWWSEDFEGRSQKLNDEFTVRFGETFITIKIIELIADQKIGWRVTDCYKHWIKDKKEWLNTTMTWEILPGKDATKIGFTHVGLVPGLECYGGCEKAWNFYIKESLFKWLTGGKGVPELKVKQGLSA